MSKNLQTKEEQWEEKIRQEFQDFADGIIWSNDDGSEKYIGVGNMADWWIDKIQKIHQEVIESTKEGIAREIEKLEIECPNHNPEERVECYGYDELHNQTVKKSADIAKNYSPNTN